MLCNISQNAMGQLGGGVPCQVQPGGGGTLPDPARGVPWRGVPWTGGYPGRGGTLAGGVPWPGGYPGWGGTQLGQHREYLLHGGRYASCIHAGGLSCSDIIAHSLLVLNLLNMSAFLGDNLTGKMKFKMQINVINFKYHWTAYRFDHLATLIQSVLVPCLKSFDYLTKELVLVDKM